MSFWRKKNRLLAPAWIVVLIAAVLLSGCINNKVTSNQATSNTAPEPLQQQLAELAKPEKHPQILQNTNFELEKYGWSPQEGIIESEESGNKYIRVAYTWGSFQFMQVWPGESYLISAKVKQGSPPLSPARFAIIFYDQDHKIMRESLSFTYTPGYDWDNFPISVFTVPDKAVFTKLFLLSNGKGTVCFDNISVSWVNKDLIGTPETDL